MPAEALAGLARNPSIKYVSPDRAVQPTMDYAVPAVGADLALDYGWDGTGIGVAIIDSGIRNLIGFRPDKGTKSRVVYSESFDPAAEASDDLRTRHSRCRHRGWRDRTGPLLYGLHYIPRDRTERRADRPACAG